MNAVIDLRLNKVVIDDLICPAEMVTSTNGESCKLNRVALDKTMTIQPYSMGKVRGRMDRYDSEAFAVESAFPLDNIFLPRMLVPGGVMIHVLLRNIGSNPVKIKAGTPRTDYSNGGRIAAGNR